MQDRVLSRHILKLENCLFDYHKMLRSQSKIDFNPADTDVIKTSSGRLKKVTTSYDQTRRLQDIWQMTSDLRHLEDV